MITFAKCLERRSRLPLAALCGILAATAGATASAETSAQLPQSRTQGEPPAEQRIDASAQKALAVTIYNDDLALVKDLRGLTLTQGENRLAWRNVSAKIRPETALLSETAGRLQVSLLEQNFHFDLLDADSLLKKYVGRSVRVIRTNDAGQRTEEEAKVLAANNGAVLRYADRIETGVIGHLAYPDVPANLRDEPTLVLHLHAQAAGEGAFELSYLTRGLSWEADYVANLTADGAAMDLNGWVTLTNASGIAYPGALVQLVAGEVNQVRWGPQPRFEFRKLETVVEAPKPQEESLDQYHLYTLSRTTDIGNNQTKQVALLSAPRIPVTRELVLQSSAYLAHSHFGKNWVNLSVASRLSFLNQDGSLGMPLPKGSVRVYSKDRHGNAQFVGEDEIGHTPKGETVSLKLGKSFDVTARRKQTSYKKLSGTSAYDYAVEVGFEMELKNARPHPVTVKVIDELPGDWTIIQSSQPHTREAANLASWQVQIPSEGAVTLTWLVQARF